MILQSTIGAKMRRTHLTLQIAQRVEAKNEAQKILETAKPDAAKTKRSVKKDDALKGGEKERELKQA